MLISRNHGFQCIRDLQLRSSGQDFGNEFRHRGARSGRLDGEFVELDLAANAASLGAKVWQASGGREPLTLKGHTGYVMSVSWSSGGTRLATGSWDGTAKMWDVAGGRELLTLHGHTNRIASVAVAPDGQRIVTGSLDNTARVWMAASPEEVEAWRKEEQAVAK